jgi:hypothetical protein
MADGSHSPQSRAPAAQRSVRISWGTDAKARLRAAWESGGLAAARAEFPGASDVALSAAARRQQLPCFGVNRAWTDNERALVRELYPQIGPRGVQALLPHRTYGAVAVFARQIGVRHDAHWWSPAERDAVSDAYASGGREAVVLLGLRRSIESSINIASVPSPRWWSSRDERTLCLAWRRGGCRAACVALPHRTKSSIQAKARHLKLARQMIKARWDRTDLDMLRAMYPRRGAAGCATVMTWRTRAAIRGKACELGLRFMPYDSGDAA